VVVGTQTQENGRVVGERVLDRRQRDPATRPHVAMVGTYDVANFGDLLFPVIARREIEQRLGSFDLTLYSYGAMSPTTWPLHVHPIAQLRHDITGFDLLLLGGGHLIRADTAIAPGYLPSDPVVHHPLGLWLTPVLLATAAGVPVAWNAPSASPDIPATLTPLLAAALDASGYVALRDLPSARILQGYAPNAALHIAPDTAFGVGQLLPEARSDPLESLLVEMGISGRYVVVQPTSQLAPYRQAVCAIVDAAIQEGMSVVELPIGPVHGDEAGILGLPVTTHTPSSWPEPLLLAELLACSQAVVAVSLHAGIVAVVAGVPLFHPPSIPDSKCELLDRISGVYALPRDGSAMQNAFPLGRTEPSVLIREYVARLQHHWDRVTQLVEDSAPRHVPAPVLLGLVELLPHLAGELHSSRMRGEMLQSRLEQSARESEALRMHRVADRLARIRGRLSRR